MSSSKEFTCSLAAGRAIHGGPKRIGDTVAERIRSANDDCCPGDREPQASVTQGSGAHQISPIIESPEADFTRTLTLQMPLLSWQLLDGSFNEKQSGGG